MYKIVDIVTDDDPNASRSGLKKTDSDVLPLLLPLPLDCRNPLGDVPPSDKLLDFVIKPNDEPEVDVPAAAVGVVAVAAAVAVVVLVLEAVTTGSDTITYLTSDESPL